MSNWNGKHRSNWKRKQRSRKEYYLAFLRQGRIQAHPQGGDGLTQTPLGSGGELRIATPRGAEGNHGSKPHGSESCETPHAQTEKDNLA